MEIRKQLKTAGPGNRPYNIYFTFVKSSSIIALAKVKTLAKPLAIAKAKTLADRTPPGRGIKRELIK